MKYGILYNRNNKNFGDDIQAYAIARFYPHVDYVIDRETMSDFTTDDGEPVAVIMNAWYMWKKWNWPPSKYIYPLFVGFHYSDHELSKQPGSPVHYEYLTGEGGRYLNAWGPVGARDYYTRDQLEKIGVDSFFSGCITLTIPKQKIEDRGRYICVVDVDTRVRDKIISDLEGTGIDVRIYSHMQERNKKRTGKQREAEVIERLCEYQNAVCVVTKKLHCALPCLAMEVPVLLVKDMKNDIRFTPYYDFLHWVRPGAFLKGKYDYDLTDPPANKPDYKPVRDEMIRLCRDFVEKVKDDTRSVDEINRYGEPEETVLKWRIATTENVLENWMTVLEKKARECSDLQKEYWKLLKKTGKYKEKYSRIRRLKHIYYRLADSTYKNLVPDFEADWAMLDERLKAKYGEEPGSGIEHLRYVDARLRARCNRLMKYSKEDFNEIQNLNKEIRKLKKLI